MKNTKNHLEQEKLDPIILVKADIDRKEDQKKLLQRGVDHIIPVQIPYEFLADTITDIVEKEADKKS